MVVTPEHGLISTTLPLEPLWSGLQAAEATLNQLQVQGICSEARKYVNLQFRHLQEMGEKEGLNFEVERLIQTLLRGGRWRIAQVRIK